MDSLVHRAAVLLLIAGIYGCVNYEPLGHSATAPAPAVRPGTGPAQATAAAPASAKDRRAACRLAVQQGAEVQSFEDPVFAEPGQVTAMREFAWRQRAYRECMSGEP